MLSFKLLLQISSQQLQLPVKVALGAPQAGQQRVALLQQSALEFFQRIPIVLVAWWERAPGVEAGTELIQDYRSSCSAGPLRQKLPEGWRQAR